MKKRNNLVVLFDRECPTTDAEADRQLAMLMAVFGDEDDSSMDAHSPSLHFNALLASQATAGELVLH